MTLTPPPPLATVGIASIGEMGLGIATLLSAHNYRVLTNVSGRRSVDILAAPLPLSLLKSPPVNQPDSEPNPPPLSW